MSGALTKAFDALAANAFRNALDTFAASCAAEDVDIEDLQATLTAWREARAGNGADPDVTEMVAIFASAGLDRLALALLEKRAVIFVTPDSEVTFAWDEVVMTPTNAAAIRHILDLMLTGQPVGAAELHTQGGHLN